MNAFAAILIVSAMVFFVEWIDHRALKRDADRHREQWLPKGVVEAPKWLLSAEKHFGWDKPSWIATATERLLERVVGQRRH